MHIVHFRFPSVAQKRHLLKLPNDNAADPIRKMFAVFFCFTALVVEFFFVS